MKMSEETNNLSCSLPNVRHDSDDLFERIKVIGKGGYATVALAECRSPVKACPQTSVALKIFKKSTLHTANDYKYLRREVNIPSCVFTVCILLV